MSNFTLTAKSVIRQSRLKWCNFHTFVSLHHFSALQVQRLNCYILSCVSMHILFIVVVKENCCVVGNTKSDQGANYQIRELPLV